MIDILISNAKIVDGSGAKSFRADVGIKRGKILKIGSLNHEDAKREIDAKGFAVSPGFVDVHTHSDITLLANPKAESAVRQGVTTHVFPNCGMGTAPAVGEALKEIEKNLEPYDLKVEWETAKEYFSYLESKRPAINVVPMVAQGTIRLAVLGYQNRAPNTRELEEMKQHVLQAMDSGIVGLCSGLRYVPSGYANVNELSELCKIVHEYGGVYASHIRSEGDNGNWFDAINEALVVGMKSGVRVQISHLKALGTEVRGKSSKALSIIKKAQRAGVDVMCDQYPYEASSSHLFVLFPQWCQADGVDEFLKRIENKEQEPRIRKEFEKTLALRGGPARMTVTMFAPNRSLEGKTLDQISKKKRLSHYEASIFMIREAKGEVNMIFHVLEDKDIDNIFRQSFVMVASDGSALAPYGVLAKGYFPHPRNYGCFPRVLSKYVRKKKLVSLEEAIRKMSYLPATRFGLKQRGLVKEGWAADLVVFNPKTVEDLASFEKPQLYPKGISCVIVNGEIVIDNGKHTDKRPGQVLYNTGENRN